MGLEIKIGTLHTPSKFMELHIHFYDSRDATFLRWNDSKAYIFNDFEKQESGANV